MCEMLNREAIRPGMAPKDGHFGFNISELQALVSSGTLDHTFEWVYKEVDTVFMLQFSIFCFYFHCFEKKIKMCLIIVSVFLFLKRKEKEK